MTQQDDAASPLPACVTDYVSQVIRRMRYSRSARREVRQELTDHFTDALADCPDPQQRQKLAERLIAEFGDTKMLAALLRRAKKRNRPVWIKALIRTAQAFLLLIVLFILYTAWFMTGRPTISTNYLAVLSERLQPKAPESENAWPFYRQAVLHFVRPPNYLTPPPTTQPSEPQPVYRDVWSNTDVDLAQAPDFVRTAIRKHIDDNQLAWEEFVAASRKPYSWYALGTTEALQQELAKVEAARKGETMQPSAAATQPDDWIWKDSLVSSLLPPLNHIRSLTKAGIFKAHLAVVEGNPQEALEDALTVARVARHWQNPNGYVIEQLVGTAISNLASEEIRRLASYKALTAGDLGRVQEQLEGLYPRGYPGFSVESERLSLIDTIQRVFTEGGPGGGHPIPRQAWFVASVLGRGDSAESGPSIGITSFLTGTLLLHAGRDETLALGNAYYDRLAEWSKLTPYQQKDKTNPDLMVMKMQGQLRYQILHMFLPSLSKGAELGWRARAEYEAAITVLALQRYRLDKGQYPPSLEALVQAGYLRQLPADPYSAGSLVYRRTDDAFILYSVAGNFVDDGGFEIPDDPWEGRMQDGRGSDRVFWPVPALKPFTIEDEPLHRALAR